MWVRKKALHELSYFMLILKLKLLLYKRQDRLHKAYSGWKVKWREWGCRKRRNPTMGRLTNMALFVSKGWTMMPCAPSPQNTGVAAGHDQDTVDPWLQVTQNYIINAQFYPFSCLLTRKHTVLQMVSISQWRKDQQYKLQAHVQKEEISWSIK